jgi:exopolysaccharide biosynthesis predicted pyruvyltransferase EpsI/glycosyltransferase involved in cell wall biosynthesis
MMPFASAVIQLKEPGRHFGLDEVAMGNPKSESNDSALAAQKDNGASLPIADDIDLPVGDLKTYVNDLTQTLRRLVGQRSVALFDWPNYANAGDHFIWLGEKVLFKNRLGCRVLYECSLNQLDLLRVARLPPETVLVMHGGGNFGDLYDHHQRFREAIVAVFPDRRIVFMPQTVHFVDRERMEQSARRMTLHPDLHVIARDHDSLVTLRSQMGLANTYLHIDSAFALQPIVTALVNALAAAPERDVVYLLRRDAEAARTVPSDEGSLRVDWGRADDLTQFAAHAPDSKSIDLARDIIDGEFDLRSWRQLCAAIRLFSKGRRIVTDRLHGHILAIMMKKGHELHDNSYGKNSAFFRTWTRASPLVTIVGKMKERPTTIPLTNYVGSQIRSGRNAIITPYYKESRDVLERCIGSVRNQTVATDHFLVADGFAKDWIDRADVRHFRLDRCHSDYGDTPRGVGAMIAAAEGYQTIGFLDADCWLEPDHVEYCLELAKQAGPDGCDYVIALRHERRPDGTIINVGQVSVERHVDTNCYFFLKSGFCVLPVWSSIPREVSIVGDRVFYAAVKANSLVPVVAARKTVNYTCLWESIYRAIGEQPPDGAKPNPDHDRVKQQISELSAGDLLVINRLIQTKLEDLYPMNEPRASVRNLPSGTGDAAMNVRRRSRPPEVKAAASVRSRRQKICLCMIVRDEAPAILRCLESVRPIIDYWIIVDTGSTDGTQDVIREYFGDFPGKLHQQKWVDFAYNRSAALVLARNHGDYSLIIDADDVLELPPGFTMPQLSADSYTVEIRNKERLYWRPQIVRNTIPWRYEGVLHEFLSCVGKNGRRVFAENRSQKRLAGARIRMSESGARRRSSSTERFGRDVMVLEHALQTEADPFLVSRYKFYLAQSYLDSGNKQKALQAYQERSALGGWEQEVFISLYRSANIKAELGFGEDDVIETYLRAHGVVKNRAEPLHGAAKFCRIKKRFQDGCGFAERALQIRLPDDGLFLEEWIYAYGVLDEYAVNAYWIGNYEESLKACRKILGLRNIPEGFRNRVQANADLASKKL